MAILDFNIDDGLMIVTVTGDITAAEIISAIKEHYHSGAIRDVIWDLTNGSMNTISNSDLGAIARAAMEAVTSGARPDGRTYFVCSSVAEYTAFCKYIVSAELLGTPAKYQVFKTLEEAKYVLKRHR